MAVETQKGSSNNPTPAVERLFAAQKRQQTVASPTGLRGFYLAASTLYGLAFGLGFAGLAWGRGAWLMAQFGSQDGLNRLMLGLPAALALSFLAAWLPAAFGDPQRSNITGAAVVVWAVGGGLLGYYAGRLPYAGWALPDWLESQGLLEGAFLAYGEAASMMAGIMAVVGVTAGAVVGILQPMALQWAWDRSRQGNRMSLGSLLAALASLPLALIMAQTVNMLVHRPLQDPFYSVAQEIQKALPEKELALDKRRPGPLRTFAGRLSPEYRLYLIELDTEIFTGGYIDAAFNGGLNLRCAVMRIESSGASNYQLVSCIDFGEKLAGRMHDLVHAGLTGEQTWRNEDWQKLVVVDSVTDWLEGHKPYLSEDFSTGKVEQQGDSILMQATFDNGVEITCHFEGRAPLVVDACQAEGETLVAENKSGKDAAPSATLPGVQVFPTGMLGTGVPWMDLDESAIPAASYVQFNPAAAPFDAVAVRQAFSQAVDRQAIVLEVFSGNKSLEDLENTFVLPSTGTNNSVADGVEQFGQDTTRLYASMLAFSKLDFQSPRPATSFIPPGVLGRDLYGRVGLRFKPQDAQQRLTQAGYHHGEGLPTISLIYPKGGVQQALSAALWENWLVQLGVEVNLEGLEVEAYQARLASGQYQMALASHIAAQNDPHSFLSNFQTAVGASEQLVTMIEQAAAESDPAARQALYVQIERLLCESEALVIPALHYTIDG